MKVYLLRHGKYLYKLISGSLLYPMSSYYRSSPVMSQVAYPYADLLREETNEAFHVTDSATAERSIDSSYNQLILPAWESTQIQFLRIFGLG